MPNQAPPPVLMEGVRIIFRNFRGEEGPYNPKGTRTFAVLLDEKVAEALAADEWNVKWLKPREDDEDEGPPQPYLPVTVRFDVYPPKVVLVTSRGRTHLDDHSIEMLDWANIINVDLIVRGFPWGPINDKSGLKAYVQSMYVTIEEDPLEMKYSEVDSA